jgi:transcription termination/antitermination protein NusG
LPEQARWYVIHTYSGYENKVASNLEKTVENRQLHDLIQQVLVPTETVTEIKDDKPIPLTDEEVAKLGVEKKEVEVSYDVGDSVQIIDGPLEGFVGVVEEVDKDKNRVRVTVSMFGRETPVELELHQAQAME